MPQIEEANPRLEETEPSEPFAADHDIPAGTHITEASKIFPVEYTHQAIGPVSPAWPESPSAAVSKTTKKKKKGSIPTCKTELENA